MFDVVVIGGGVAGSSTAYELVGLGLRTALVQRTDPGTATMAGAGIVLPVSPRTQPDPWYDLIFPAVAHYDTVVASLAGDGATDVGYARSGALFPVRTADERGAVDTFRRQLAGRDWIGATGVGDVDLLSSGDARREFPPLREGTDALRLSGAARVDGRRLRRALQHAFRRRGGEVLDGDATVAFDGDRVVGVVVGGDLHPAPAVVVASGAWTDVLGARPDLARSVPVAPQRGQILHLDVPDVETGAWPIVDCVDGHYLLAFPPNRVVVGATRESGAGFDHRVTVQGQAELLGVVDRVAPGLGSATVVETRVGFRPASPDGFPLLGPLRAVEGVFVLDGLGASGLTLGPYCGRLVAGLVAGRAPDLPLDAFRPDRFVGSLTPGPPRTAGPLTPGPPRPEA